METRLQMVDIVIAIVEQANIEDPPSEVARMSILGVGVGLDVLRIVEVLNEEQCDLLR